MRTLSRQRTVWHRTSQQQRAPQLPHHAPWPELEPSCGRMTRLGSLARLQRGLRKSVTHLNIQPRPFMAAPVLNSAGTARMRRMLTMLCSPWLVAWMIALSPKDAVAQPKTLQQCLDAYGDGTGCQIARPGKYPYDCSYNNRPMRCSGFRNNTIEWEDGVITRVRFLRLATPADLRRVQATPSPVGTPIYTDDRGGIWWLLTFARGNIRLNNEETGNSIFIPHAPTCHPPMTGTVGYCTVPASRTRP